MFDGILLYCCFAYACGGGCIGEGGVDEHGGGDERKDAGYESEWRITERMSLCSPNNTLLEYGAGRQRKFGTEENVA